MRLLDHLFESNLTDMAKEFVSFQNYINRVLKTEAKNPEKAQNRMRKAFIVLEKEIRKSLKEK